MEEHIPISPFTRGVNFTNHRQQVRTPAEMQAVSYISNRFYEYFAQVRLMRYELDLGHKEAALSNYKAAQDVRGITQASVTQQLTAEAGADISRLLLSPNSPGLDSTFQSLSVEVKRIFNPDSLKAAYDSKQKRIYEKLNELWVLANTTGETNALCKINIGPNGNVRCGAGQVFRYDQFLNGVKQVEDRFDRWLLADAIQINITPKSAPAQNLTSAREPYNQFLAALDEFGTLNKASFTSRACNALAVSKFCGNCASNTIGYINLLQFVVWIAYPLVVLFVAVGIWFASRLF